VVQKICLAFTVSTLYLLVQPRPEDVDGFELKVSRGLAISGFETDGWALFS
jgi:hypothetical protein